MFDVIDAALERGEHVLVHCEFARSRSPTLIISYLMRKNKLTKEDAKQMIAQHWRVNSTFDYHLGVLQQRLLGNNTAKMMTRSQVMSQKAVEP